MATAPAKMRQTLYTIMDDFRALMELMVDNNGEIPAEHEIGRAHV